MTSKPRLLAWSLAATLAVGCSTAKPKPDEATDAAPDAGAAPAAAAPAPVAEAKPEEKKADDPKLADKPADQGKKLGAADDDSPSPQAPPTKIGSSEVQAGFKTAIEQANAGQNDAAIDTLKSVVAKDGSQYWAYFDLGAIEERKGQNDAALDAYHHALDAEPGLGAASMAEARMLARQKRTSEAESDLRTRLAKSPKALGLANALVYTLIQENQYDNAIAEARKVLKVDEKNVDVMFQLATIYYRQGKNERALNVLTNAEAIRPEDPLIHNAMGFVHIALGERSVALEDFKTAAALSPDFAEAHNNLGALLNEAQDFPGAEKELEMAVRDAPDFVGARLNLGNAYRGDKKYDQALAEYQKVMQLKPDNRDVLFNMAVLYFDGEFGSYTLMQRLDQAQAYFTKYTSAGGDDARVPQYLKDLDNLRKKEQRRLERDEKKKLKDAEKAKKDADKAQKDAAAADAKAKSDAAAADAKAKADAAKPHDDGPGTKLKASDDSSSNSSSGSKLKDPDDTSAPAPSKAKPAPAPSSNTSGTKLKDPDDTPAPTPASGGGKLGGGDDK